MPEHGLARGEWTSMQHARWIGNLPQAHPPLGSTPPSENGLTHGAALAEVPRRFHRCMPGYKPTPLYTLPALADALGIGTLLVKDESERFELPAFKVLGASFAIQQLLMRQLEAAGSPISDPAELFAPQTLAGFPKRTFATATDGNHGRAVAHMARLLGQNAEIYLPAHSASARIEAIQAEGARVTRVEGTYDEAVERVKQDAARYGWSILSDTSWPGYDQVPGWIAQGYTTLFDEVSEQCLEQGFSSPDVVLLQAGVGAFLAAGILYYGTHQDHPPKAAPQLVSVEPLDAACLLESAAVGVPTRASGALRSLMAGLNCGLPSLSAWPLIQRGTSGFVGIDDAYAEAAMYRLFRPLGRDPQIVAGESGAAGLGGLMALCLDADLEAARACLPLSGQHTVLVINTEGATDPLNFQRWVGASPYERSSLRANEPSTPPAA